MKTADMGGSDPAVLWELQEAGENQFPEQSFDGNRAHPVDSIKNQVRTFTLRVASSQVCSVRRTIQNYRYH